MGAVKSVIRCEAALGLLLEPMAELSLIRSLISLSVTLTSNKCTLETRGKEAGADVEMHQMIKCSVSISKKKKKSSVKQFCSVLLTLRLVSYNPRFKSVETFATVEYCQIP